MTTDEPSIEPQAVNDVERARLPSNGGSSQDSIDKLIDDFAYELYLARKTSTAQDYDDEEARLKAIYRKTFTAWHNTQLKALLESLRDKKGDFIGLGMDDNSPVAAVPIEAINKVFEEKT